MYYKTAFIALGIVLGVNLPFAAGQATQPETQPETQPAAPAGEAKLPQLTDEQRDKISALWESLFKSGGDMEAAEKARQAVLDEKDLAAAFLYEQFVEAKLDVEAVAKLIAELDSDVWKKRETTSQKLITKGFNQADLIISNVESAASLEVKQRLLEISESLDSRFHTALEMLIAINSDASWATVYRLAHAAPDAGNAKFVAGSFEAFRSELLAAAKMLIDGRFRYFVEHAEEMDCPLDPESQKAFDLVNRLSIKLEDAGAASLAMYGILIKLMPEDPRNYMSRAYMLASLDRNEEALADFSRAIELSPNSANLYGWRAQVYMNLDRKQEALADSTAAIRIEPNQTMHYMQRTRIYVSLGENDKALADLESAMKVADCDGVRAWVCGERAKIYQNTGRLDKCLDDLKKAVELSKEVPYPNAQHCNELAWFYVTCEDPAYRDVKAALECSQAAANSEYCNEAILDTLACAYADDGQWDKAIETERKALEYTGDEDNFRQEFTERLEGFKNHKTYLQQQADKKQKTAPESRPDTQPETQPATQP